MNKLTVHLWTKLCLPDLNKGLQEFCSFQFLLCTIQNNGGENNTLYILRWEFSLVLSLSTLLIFQRNLSGSIPLTHQQQHQYWMLSFRCRPGVLNTLFTCETCIQQTCRGSCMILTLQTRKLEPRKINAVSISLPRSSWMEFYLRFSHSRRNTIGKAPADQKPPNPTTPIDFMNFDLKMFSVF